MSHIVKIETEVRDPVAVRSACDRLRLPQPVQGTHRLFGGEVAGLGVQLPDWHYPAVCQLDNGEDLGIPVAGEDGPFPLAIGVEQHPPSSSPYAAITMFQPFDYAPAPSVNRL